MKQSSCTSSSTQKRGTLGISFYSLQEPFPCHPTPTPPHPPPLSLSREITTCQKIFLTNHPAKNNSWTRRTVGFSVWRDKSELHFIGVLSTFDMLELLITMTTLYDWFCKNAYIMQDVVAKKKKIKNHLENFISLKETHITLFLILTLFSVQFQHFLHSFICLLNFRAFD